MQKHIDMTTEQFEAEQKSMSDKELIKNVKKQISELAKTGGRSHRMCVPPQVTDTDMLLGELVRRFEKSIEIVQPSEVMPSDSELVDLEQYITNVLYAACDEGRRNVGSSKFDKWVEEMIDGIDGYFKSQLKPAENEEKKTLLLKFIKWYNEGYPEALNADKIVEKYFNSIK